MESKRDDPAISRWLMRATYAVGGIGLFVSFWLMSSGNREAAAAWASAVAVGGAGLLSFVRHSVFHRSDAARMNWDLGRRNDFQIEVGLANLAWGVTGVAAWALDWGTRAEGGITIVFGLYLLGAAVLHASELRQPEESGGGRLAPTLATAAFAVMLLAAGGAAVRL